VLAQPGRVSPSLDFFSEQFDPIRALNTSTLQAPEVGVKPLDNIFKYQTLYPTPLSIARAKPAPTQQPKQQTPASATTSASVCALDQGKVSPVESMPTSTSTSSTVKGDETESVANKEVEQQEHAVTLVAATTATSSTQGSCFFCFFFVVDCQSNTKQTPHCQLQHQQISRRKLQSNSEEWRGLVFDRLKYFLQFLVRCFGNSSSAP
jgi:hypothetical protein